MAQPEVTVQVQCQPLSSPEPATLQVHSFNLQEIRESMLASCNEDPGLPRPNPTIAFWQEPPHPTVANIRSESLPKSVDIVVIGSGITACSTVKALLENPTFSGQRVTVLEARALTSGATGRNGGHLVSAAAHDYPGLVAIFGKEKAVEAARFSLRCVERVREVVATLDDGLKSDCELRDVVSSSGLQDEGAVSFAKNSIAMFEEAIPEYAGYFKITEDKEVLESFGFQKALAIVSARAGALWPYRLVTGIFSRLLEKYPDRLTIETTTPATAVSHNPSATRHEYKVTTPRGVIEASRVIYCSNAHTGHLLPHLRGKLFPLRGTMSTQKAGPSFSNYGASRSWSTQATGSLDPKTGILNSGLVYVTQNAHTGDVFIGGEQQKYYEIMQADDTFVPETPTVYLSTLLPKIFKGWDDTKPEIKRIWSGIMCFTSDSVPIVGNLSESMTGRAGTGEWIAAGFNGYGMDKCWLTGEALVGLIAGDEGAVQLPEAYRVTSERFNGALQSAAAFVEILLDDFKGKEGTV